jgi:hypothetical protein
MSTPEETARRADLEAEPAEGRREDGALIDADVEADVNAAVPDDDDERDDARKEDD